MSKKPKLKACPIRKDTPIPLIDGRNPAKGYKWRMYCVHHPFLCVEGNGSTEENSHLGIVKAWNKAVNVLVKYKEAGE